MKTNMCYKTIVYLFSFTVNSKKLNLITAEILLNLQSMLKPSPAYRKLDKIIIG